MLSGKNSAEPHHKAIVPINQKTKQISMAAKYFMMIPNDQLSDARPRPRGGLNRGWAAYLLR